MDYMGLITYTIIVFCMGALLGCVATELEHTKIVRKKTRG